MKQKVNNYVNTLFNKKGSEDLKEFMTFVIHNKVKESKLFEESVSQDVVNRTLQKRIIAVWEHQIKESYPQLQDTTTKDFLYKAEEYFKEEGLELISVTFNKYNELLFVLYDQGTKQW